VFGGGSSDGSSSSTAVVGVVVVATVAATVVVVVKCKAIPEQAWVGPQVSRKLRLPHFKTVGS
jgi:hypothetical protein